MAITSTNKRNSISMKLSTGTSSSGAITTTSQNLGTLKTATFNDTDKQKAFNIINLLAPCLMYSLYRVEFTAVQNLDEDE